MERVASSVREDRRAQAIEEFDLNTSYNFSTISQTINTWDSDEFRDAIRGLSGPILALDAEVAYFEDVPYSADLEQASPPAFKLTYRADFIEIGLARNSAENMRTLFSQIEEVFSLETVKPKSLDEQDAIRKRTAFLAHNFNQKGKSYAYELVKFLNLIGFEVSTGEGYSPESISKKVKKRLTAQEVIIVIASEKEDDTWLIQEAAGATFTGKPVMMLVEEGVEFKPGIHGDLEYINFRQGEISSTFIPLLEGLQELGYGFK